MQGFKRSYPFRPTRGVAYDVPPPELSDDFWSFAQNVIFRMGFAARALGSRAVYGTLPTAAQAIQNVLVGSTNFWLVYGADEIHALETSNADEVTPAAGLQTITAPWYWSPTLLNGVPCATNGLDTPIYWAGDVGTPFVNLPDFPASTICKSLIAYKYHLFALDIDGPSGHFYDQVLWSDAADPGSVPSSWTASGGSEAGSAQISDTPGPIMCGRILRGTLLLYKRSSMAAVEYLPESNDIFSFRTLFSTSGALNRHSVCDVNGQHFVVADGDVILTDGVNRRSVAQGRMKDYLFNQLDQTYYENLFCLYHRGKNEVWTFFPEQGGDGTCTLAIVYDVSNDAWGVRDIDVTCAGVGVVNDTAADETWDADTEVWDDDTSYWNAANYSLAAESLVHADGTAATLEDTTDTVSVTNSVRRDGLTFGDATRLKLVKRLHVRAKSGFGSLLVRVGSTNTPEGSVTWSSEVTLTEPEQIVNTFALGRYISVQVRSTGTDLWQIDGIDFEFEWRGYH